MMSIASRRELLAVVAPRYRAAAGKDRRRILDEFLASTGYYRKYALSLLTMAADVVGLGEVRETTDFISCAGRGSSTAPSSATTM